MKANFRIVLLSSFAFVFLGHPVIVIAQVPDFFSMTLNFENVTSTRVNSTVAEIADNDKSVDFGDFDQDGDLDVVISCARSDFGQRRNKLYRNDDGLLNEVSGTEILPEFAQTDTSRTALFRDFDNDGWPDILIVNDSLSGTATITSPGRTRLYRNVNGQAFVNETLRLNSPSGAASAGVAADFDGNGLLDLAFSNHPNTVQDSITFNSINGNPAGTFLELTSTHIPPDTQYGKHVTAADMNGDGMVDLLVGNQVSGISFIYYNNNQDAGSGPGDFRYDSTGSSTELPSAAGSTRERTLVPADFNNDGRLDFYFANEGSFGSILSDAIYVNNGNDTDNRVIFEPQPLSSDLNDESLRAEVNDLDGDGKVDLVVVCENKRPYLFRNTSENGEVSFVEWTPAEINLLQAGWGVRSANLLGSPSPELLFGATNDDFLFENVASPSFSADNLNGQLPLFHDEDPIQIVGQLRVGSDAVFSSNDLPLGANVSLLLRSLGDTSLRVLVDGVELFDLDRPGNGSDEAIQFTHPGGTLTLVVAINSVSFDGNSDGLVTLLDVAPFVDCLTGASSACDPFDTNDDGVVTLLDVDDFIIRLANGTKEEPYFLEMLSRNN